MNYKLCDYGCGKEAKYTFKNGKVCCSRNHSNCPSIIQKIQEKMTVEEKQRISKHFKILWNSEEYRNKVSNKMLNRKYSNFIEIQTNELCKYGCGQIAKYTSKNGKLCCSDYPCKCPSNRKKYGKFGIENPMYGKKQSDKCKEINSKLKKGKSRSLESIRKQKETCNKPKFKENVRKRMKEWQAFYMLKKIKNPSNEEIKLRNIIFELFPKTSKHSYRILNYCVDIAIPLHKIVIEYDGYYHFYSEDAKLYFQDRKQKIQNEGWKILTYTMYEKFPSKDKIYNDIISLRN